MKPCIVFVASHRMTLLAFLLPHLKSLSSLASVYVFVNCPDSALRDACGANVKVIHVPLVRTINVFNDIWVLLILFLRIISLRPCAVHTITPKAGLLGVAAAWLACVPLRIHSFTGQVWITRHGFRRWILKASDLVIASLATEVLVDSPSQRRFLVNEHVLSDEKSSVLANGSICGVNLNKFCPSLSVRSRVRQELGTPDHSVVCLYLGRLNYDKGLLDLSSAFSRVASVHPQSELWVVGPDEADLFPQMLSSLGAAAKQVKRIDYTDTPQRYMQASDLFCLPSYREGFGSSVIEAAACGIPSCVSRIYGLTDAVLEGQTGWMHEPGNVEELTTLILKLLFEPKKLKSAGMAARSYVAAYFSQELVTGAMTSFYSSRINETIL